MTVALNPTLGHAHASRITSRTRHNDHYHQTSSRAHNAALNHVEMSLIVSHSPEVITFHLTDLST